MVSIGYIPEKHIIFLFVPMFAVDDRANVGRDAIFFSIIGSRLTAMGAMVMGVGLG